MQDVVKHNFQQSQVNCILMTASSQKYHRKCTI